LCPFVVNLNPNLGIQFRTYDNQGWLNLLRLHQTQKDVEHIIA